jgi:hypothetical protein
VSSQFFSIIFPLEQSSLHILYNNILGAAAHKEPQRPV